MLINYLNTSLVNNNRDSYFFKIGELFKMNYSAVSQVAKRFEQKSEVKMK